MIVYVNSTRSSPPRYVSGEKEDKRRGRVYTTTILLYYFVISSLNRGITFVRRAFRRFKQLAHRGFEIYNLIKYLCYSEYPISMKRSSLFTCTSFRCKNYVANEKTQHFEKKTVSVSSHNQDKLAF